MISGVFSLIFKVQILSHSSRGELTVCILGIIFGKGGTTSFSFHAVVKHHLVDFWHQSGFREIFS